MKKEFLILLLFLPLFLTSQHTVKGKINQGENFTWVLLYKIQNGKQIYLNNATVKDGAFELTMTEKESPGIYRIFYQMEQQLYVEFLYNKENISFTFNPNNPTESIVFSESEENIIYQNYSKTIRSQQQILDSLQVVYFNSEQSKSNKRLNRSYKKNWIELNKTQLLFENESKEKLAHIFIKSSKQYNSKDLIKDPKNYLVEVKKHFFDAVDFSNAVLKKSTLLNDKILDFVFYLNQSEDTDELHKMQKESVDISLEKISTMSVFKKNIEEELLNEFAVNQNETMLKYLLENHYKKLPRSLQDSGFIQHILSEVKTVIGKIAPDISWEENGVSKSLYDENNSNIYIVVFFSSGCQHCQNEIPILHDLVKTISNVKVIAIGLEDEKASWKEMIKDYSGFVNVLDLDKWDSKRARDYGINSIPSYFILDKEKRILAKPEDIEVLKQYFE